MNMVAKFDEAVVSNALAVAAAHQAKALRRIQQIRDAARRWHLVQINATSFKLASDQLEWAGYDLYAPQIRDIVLPKTSTLSLAQRKNRHLFGKERLSPFFGSYRFVRFDAARDPYHDLFKLTGIHGIGVKNNLPVPMPDAFIASLKAQEVNGAIPGSTPVKAFAFNIGEIVRVNTGPLVGFDGTVERIDESGRIRLLLEMFAGLTPVDVSAEEVDKVPISNSHP